MFYDELKRVCKERKTSPSAIALAVGMSKANVTRWKAGQEPNVGTVSKIADYLGIGMADLLGGGTIAKMRENDYCEGFVDALEGEPRKIDKPATVSSGGLTDEEWNLILKYRTASDEIKGAVIRIVEF